jgi:hypothetical protein
MVGALQNAPDSQKSPRLQFVDAQGRRRRASATEARAKMSATRQTEAAWSRGKGKKRSLKKTRSQVAGTVNKKEKKK